MLLQFKQGSTPDNLLEGEDIDTFAKAMDIFVEDPFCPSFVKEEFLSAKVAETDDKKKKDANDELADDELSDADDEDDGQDFMAPDVFPELYPGDMSMFDCYFAYK